MRKTAGTIAGLLAVVLLLPACALSKGPPDPEKVQRKLTATLEGEENLIRSTISDSQRADRLIALLEDRDRLVAEHVELVAAYRSRMASLNADYAAERSDFEEATGSYNKGRVEWQGEFIELINSMKTEASADEWKTIAKYQIKKLNPREMSYKGAGGGN